MRSSSSFLPYQGFSGPSKAPCAQGPRWHSLGCIASPETQHPGYPHPGTPPSPSWDGCSCSFPWKDPQARGWFGSDAPVWFQTHWFGSDAPVWFWMHQFGSGPLQLHISTQRISFFFCLFSFLYKTKKARASSLSFSFHFSSFQHYPQKFTKQP